MGQKNRRTSNLILTRRPEIGASARVRSYRLCTRADTAPHCAHPTRQTGTDLDLHHPAVTVDPLDIHAGQVRQQPIDPHKIARPTTLARQPTS